MRFQKCEFCVKLGFQKHEFCEKLGFSICEVLEMWIFVPAWIANDSILKIFISAQGMLGNALGRGFGVLGHNGR